MALDRYAARYGIDDLDEFDRFHFLIGKMDDEWQRKQQEQLKENARSRDNSR